MLCILFHAMDFGAKYTQTQWIPSYHSNGIDGDDRSAIEKSKSFLCDQFCGRAEAELGPINIYEIYADVCLPRQARSETLAMAAALGQSGGILSLRMAERIIAHADKRPSMLTDAGVYAVHDAALRAGPIAMPSVPLQEGSLL